MDGVLNINKPSGMTSHDVVQAARRITGQKRIGHTGTLDPGATGVLVLCAGKATRIAQYIEAGEKEYKAVMRLGIITDTLDADGRVVERRPYSPPDRSALLQCSPRFYRHDHAASARLFCGKGGRRSVVQARTHGKSATAHAPTGFDLQH